MNEKPLKKQTFLGGAAVLALSTAIVKLIGACYKIPLGNLIGDAGFGYFTTAYDIYSDYVSEEDFEIKINDVNFVIAKKDKKLCDGIEIKYDKDIYNNGFYVRSI